MLKKAVFVMLASLTAGAQESELTGLVDPEQQALELAQRVEKAEEALRAASETEALALQSLLEAPEASIRMTAVRWLSTKKKTALEALAAGLADGDDLVHGVSVQILEDRLTSRELEEMLREADGKDKTYALQLLLRYGVRD